MGSEIGGDTGQPTSPAPGTTERQRERHSANADDAPPWTAHRVKNWFINTRMLSGSIGTPVTAPTTHGQQTLHDPGQREPESQRAHRIPKTSRTPSTACDR